MRLILAKIMWNFDLSLHPDSKDWMQGHHAFSLWQKPDLNVYIKPRVMQ